MVEFKGVEASFFAFKRLQYIEKDVDRLMPEIELLNPQEGSRRLQPLEQQVRHDKATFLVLFPRLRLLKPVTAPCGTAKALHFIQYFSV